MKKYRKKPVVIEAIQYIGHCDVETEKFVGENYREGENDTCIIKTLEGDMIASPLDFIIKGVKGEFYPCKPDIFIQTYEMVEEG